jgi:ABC-type nitrate/sulfonate/bicarbonate transport system permease component
MNDTSQSVFAQVGPMLPVWLQQLTTIQQVLLGLAAGPFVAIALNVFWQLVRSFSSLGVPLQSSPRHRHGDKHGSLRLILC